MGVCSDVIGYGVDLDHHIHLPITPTVVLALLTLTSLAAFFLALRINRRAKSDLASGNTRDLMHLIFSRTSSSGEEHQLYVEAPFKDPQCPTIVLFVLA